MIEVRQVMGASILGVLFMIALLLAMGWPAFFWFVILASITGFAIWLMVGGGPSQS